MENTYSSFEQASDSNWDLLVQLFGNSEKFKLIKPQRENSVYDGILICKKDGKDVIILIEVKRRQFDIHTLQNGYGNAFYLEKSKYVNLHKRANEMLKVPGRELKIWYLCKTTDGYIWIWDITNKDYIWVWSNMNEKTYTEDNVKKKVIKPITYCHIDSAIFSIKTNITK